MEDDRIQKALDRLADMYLTGATPPPAETTPAPAKRTKHAHAAPAAEQDCATLPPPAQTPPDLQLPAEASPLVFGTVPDAQRRGQPQFAATAATTADRPTRSRSTNLADQLDGPAPIRLPIGPNMNDLGRRYADDYPAIDTPTLAPAPAGHVEAVFLGNLPGFGGPWLTQYAHFLAEQLGPVIVLNVDQEQIDLELVATASDRRCVEELVRAGDVPASAGLMAAVAALTRPGLPSIGAWLVHLPMPLDETSMHVAPDLDRWTLICGSDQAALVGAYRWIKQLAVDEESAHTGRQVGLMVMGSDRDKAEAMASNLTRTAGCFLDTPVRLIGCRKQIEPVHLAILGSFEAGAELWPRITAFLADQADLSDDPDAFYDQATALDTEPGADEQPVADESPMADEYPEADEELLAEEAVSPVAAEPITAAAEQQVELDLSQFLAPATALEARCPRQEDMQIAVDRQGRLHLLLAHRGSEREVAAALTDLSQMRAWARQHAQLLQLTWRDGEIDQDADPVVHLFTAHAKAAAALVGYVDGDIRLHLLQAVVVGDASTWLCTELN